MDSINYHADLIVKGRSGTRV